MSATFLSIVLFALNSNSMIWLFWIWKGTLSTLSQCEIIKVCWNKESMKTKLNNIRYLHDYVIQGGLLNVSARRGKMVARKNVKFWKWLLMHDSVWYVSRSNESTFNTRWRVNLLIMEMLVTVIFHYREVVLFQRLFCTVYIQWLI